MSECGCFLASCSACLDQNGVGLDDRTMDEIDADAEMDRLEEIERERDAYRLAVLRSVPSWLYRTPPDERAAELAAARYERECPEAQTC